MFRLSPLMLLVFTFVMMAGFSNARAATMGGPLFFDPFRGMIWDLPLEAVKSAETAVLLGAEKESLSYILPDDDGAVALVGYHFRDNQLWKITWALSGYYPPSPDQALYRSMDIQNNLNRLFGEAQQEDMVWLDSTYRNHPRFWPRAFALGELRLRTRWQTKDTLVTFTALYENDGYQIGYTLEKQGAQAFISPFTP